MLVFSGRNLNIALTMVFQLSVVQGLLCYRCDSQFEEDCSFYPTPMSTYENCDEKPKKMHKEHRKGIYSHSSNSVEEAETQTLYIRYRYHLCPLLEKTIKQVVPKSLCDKSNTVSSSSLFPPGLYNSPNPMENANYVCGKAVTHGQNGDARVRRGCTLDIFLSGTNACVSVSPKGKTDTVCFCTTDLCNDGSSLYLHPRKSKTVQATFLFLHVIIKITL